MFGRKHQQHAQRGGSQAQRRAPDEPAELWMRSWAGVLRRTLREFNDDNLTDWSAALTYCGVLSIFPALLALVSILGLFGHHAPNHSDAPAVNGS